MWKRIPNGLPNFEIDDEGMSYDGSNGRVRLENLSLGEECFASDVVGLLNISKAWRNVNLAGRIPIAAPINDGLRQNIAKLEYDHQLVKRMTPERRDEPILMLIGFDGLHVVDGVHRLKRRMRDGMPDVQAHILPPDELRHIRVRVFEHRNGGWHQTGGLTDDQLAEHIKQAKVMEARMRRGQ